MPTPYQSREMTPPKPNPGDEPYFAAAAEGKLLLKRCTDCGRFHFYPRALCPFCFSECLEWTQAKGIGEIYSYSVTRGGVPVPYAIAYVSLDEGVRMLTNLVDCDLDTLHIGQRVRVVFKATSDGTMVPCFTAE